MPDAEVKPVRLEFQRRRSSPWPYLLLGALLGAVVEVLVSLPLDAVFRNLFEYLFAGNPIRLSRALAHLARPGERPAVSLTGFLFGGALGYVFYRLKENQKRLKEMHQEFEIRVAALRHHYKNLALGISGFSARARRKLEKVQERLKDAVLPDADIPTEIDSLELSVIVLEEASLRLASTLTEELMFIRALQGNGPAAPPRDFFPVLQHAAQELLDLRFRGKQVRVEVNGRPLAEPQTPMVFAFEPYTMEVILQNILSNAMRYGDFIQVQAAEQNGVIMVEILDNGPGLEPAEIKRNLVSAGSRRRADSTQLGLLVTLRLLEKCGGHLSVASKPGAGAAFILEFPRHPPGGR
jgi:signal transduction histidine kinase